MRLAIALGVTFVLCACGQSPPVFSPALIDDARVTMLRKLMDESGYRASVDFFCVAVASEVEDWRGKPLREAQTEPDASRFNTDRDPSDSLLARFVDFRPPVRKRSDCVRMPREGEWVAGKLRGVLFRLGAVRLLADGTIEIPASTDVHNMGFSGAIYRLARRNNCWNIRVPSWIIFS